MTERLARGERVPARLVEQVQWLHGGAALEEGVLAVGGEQSEDLGAHVRIIGAVLRDVRRAFALGQVARLAEQRRHARPPSGCHERVPGSSRRRSHARASAQSRLAVAGATSSSAAASSIVSPPK